MRFALSLASVLVLGSAAFADEATPPPAPAPAATPAAAPAAKKLPLRVVRVLQDTQQALMFDKAKGTHVLVDIGKQIDGFTVTDIDEDSVTLTAEGGQQIVLAGPDPSWRGNGRHGAQKPAVAKTASADPEDPYAAAAPMDPYGDDGVRTAEAPATPAPSATAAPITAGEGGVRTAVAPSGGATDSVRSAEAPGTPAKVIVSAAIPGSTIPTTVATSSTSTSTTPSTTTTTPATTTPSTPIVAAAAPVAEPVAARSAEPVAPIDNSSSAAWSTTPTAPVDPETAAIVALLTDSAPATTTKAPAVKTPAKATKANKNPKAKDQKIASVSAAGTPAGAAVPATASPTPPAADGATIIAKADVTAALGNFSTLANAVRGSFSADGAHLDAVAPDSLFAKAGLQAGDTITTINNQPLRSLDDAATLYSRVGSIKSATIQVLRAGKPLALHLAIQ